jgi:hypothetical protein
MGRKDFYNFGDNVISLKTHTLTPFVFLSVAGGFNYC